MTITTTYDKIAILVEKEVTELRIAGFQKLTLLDYPGKVACTIFTEGCNFHCPYCHNASLVEGDEIQSRADEGGSIGEDEILEFLTKRRGVLDGVAVSGGEPLIHSELLRLLERIKELGYSVKLDTNGTRPDMLVDLVRAGLVDHIAMDIKNSPDGYARAVGVATPDIETVNRSREFLMDELPTNVSYEFRTTLIKGIHTLHDMEQMAYWIAGAEEYYLQQFVDSGELINPNGLSAFTSEEMRDFLKTARRFVPGAELRGV